MYEIQYQWLGFGNVFCAIECPVTGRLEPVHTYIYGNVITTPSVANPTLPCYAAAINTTNTTNVTLHVGSMMLGIEGVIEPIGELHGEANTVTNAGTGEVPIMTVRNKTV